MCIGCDNEPVDRRSFLAGVTTTTAGMALAPLGDSSRALASEAAPPDDKRTEPQDAVVRALDDPAVQHEMVSFKSGKDTVEGYLARPKAAGRYRVVVVLHGDVGVPESHRNTAAQIAQGGFVGLAYKRFGRWPNMTVQDVVQSDRTDKRYLSGSFNDQELQDAQTAVDYLKAQPFVKVGGVGVVGYCGGGYQALLLATRSKDVQAVVAFYAPPEMPPQFLNPKDPRPSLFDKAAQIKVPVQGHYGGADPVVSLDIVRKFEQALRAQGTPATFYTYEGATHAFYDYTRRTYHAEAAAKAKTRMLDFLKSNLK